jgi:hypothetical protein
MGSLRVLTRFFTSQPSVTENPLDNVAPEASSYHKKKPKTTSRSPKQKPKKPTKKQKQNLKHVSKRKGSVSPEEDTDVSFDSDLSDEEYDITEAPASIKYMSLSSGKKVSYFCAFTFLKKNCCINISSREKPKSKILFNANWVVWLELVRLVLYEWE